jgi:Ca-activated chloride channel family protein
MTFLLPVALLGLLTLPLIALLHLIQRRRVRQRIPSLQLWQGIQAHTLQPKPRRLPLTLLLILHLVMAALLALALGQPLLQLAQNRATHTVLIIDTSSSMAATDEQPSRLAAAQEEAATILSGLGANDSVTLIELSQQPRVLADSTSTSLQDVQAALQYLKAGGSDGALQAALNLAQATYRPSADTRIVVLTDRSFRAESTQTVESEVSWRTFGSDEDNVAIVAFAARQIPAGGHQLYARVVNHGDAPVARTLRLDLDGDEAAAEPMNLLPQTEMEWSWSVPAGVQRASAILSGDDIQPLDDQAFLVLSEAIRTRVLLVSETPTALERALRAQRGVEVQRIAPEVYQPAASADLHVFIGIVPSTLPRVPTLIVAPPADQTLLKVEGQRANLTIDTVTDERFKGIDWRPLSFQRIAQIEVPNWADIAVAGDDVPLVLTGHLNGHPVAIWTFDPDTTNLANRLQFPLLTAATLQTLLPSTGQLKVGAVTPVQLRHTDGFRVSAGERITQPGFYEAEEIGAIAINALDRDEAILSERPMPQFSVIEPTSAEPQQTGRELWQPLVIAGLVILLLEWAYINRRYMRPNISTKQQPL